MKKNASCDVKQDNQLQIRYYKETARTRQSFSGQIVAVIASLKGAEIWHGVDTLRRSSPCEALTAVHISDCAVLQKQKICENWG